MSAGQLAMWHALGLPVRYYGNTSTFLITRLRDCDGRCDDPSGCQAAVVDLVDVAGERWAFRNTHVTAYEVWPDQPTGRPAGWAEAAVAAMRSWIADCDGTWGDIEPWDVPNLSDVEVVDGVRRHYDGGVPAFLADNTDEHGAVIL